MKKFISLAVLFGVLFLECDNIHAQTMFAATGKIEFEKKVNMFKLLEDNSWTSELKTRMPEYRISYFDLWFNDTASVYKAGKENPNDKWQTMWDQSDDKKNIVYQNFTSHQTQALKQVFEKTFLISDSMLKISWRITDETRDIAGFECRKAVGRLYDTLYVVAFYSNQIIAPTGPEQYGGLPGTILGLAFPRYYTTWFATKVEMETPTATEMKSPQPDRKTATTTRAALIKTIQGSLDWGSNESKQRTIWSIVL